MIAVKRAEEAARRLNVEIIKIPVGATGEVAEKVNSMVDRVDAIWMPPDPTIVTALEPLVKLAREKKLPLMGPTSEAVEAGALLSYAIDHYRLGRRTSLLIHKILDGAKPANLPIGSSRRTKLTLNMKTAREIECPVSSQFLAKVDKLIQ